MPKIIVTSRFIRAGNHSKLNNYVKYIATREGVELTEQRNSQQNIDREIFINYLGTRPNVVKQGTHGLFSDTDESIILDKAAKEVAQHNGTVWTHIVSLRRDDAERMGYNTLDMWRDLVCRHISDIAEAQKISAQNVRWYAAFHNKESNPHVHIVMYSVDPKEGYLTNAGIEKIRSAFANDIYRNELQNLYQQQTEVRNNIRNDAEQLMTSLVKDLQNIDEVNPTLQGLILKLSAQFQRTKGKKVYGYLQPEVKKTVDQIVAELAKTPALQKMYALWCEIEQQKYSTYTNAVPSFPPLEENKVFKPIKNSVIRAVLNMDISPELEPPMPSISPYEVEKTSNDSLGNIVANNCDIKWHDDCKTTDDKLLYRLGAMTLKGIGCTAYPEKAAEYFHRSAKMNNKYALCEYGKMLTEGDIISQDTQLGIDMLKRSAELGHSAASYALGKIYLFGKGVERNTDLAREWLTISAESGNEYAQHLLENMDRFYQTTINNAVLSMLFSFGRLISDDYERKSHTRFISERKLKAAISRKKKALGLKDDHTIKQEY